MYISHTDEDRAKMLDSIGVDSVEELFRNVPEWLRLKSLEVPHGLSEPEVLGLLSAIAEHNLNVESRPSFMGAGAYRGYVPAAVGAITGRAEFYTSYTPYQAELSQGTLQVIYEFQTMIAELTGLDVANASLYDGATALAEACGMAVNATGRDRIAILDSVNPEYVRVLRTYADGVGYAIDIIPAVPQLSIENVRQAVSEHHAALVVQTPDFLGSVNSVVELSDAVHGRGGLLVAVVDPVSLALLAPPSEYGADIAVGEGQNLGSWLSYGGPYLGFIATTTALQRRIPGRIAGATVDASGRRAYVLTLQTREQHIRRDKATSNICTNEALVALAATVYMALMGKQGLRRVAELAMQKAHYAAARIEAIPGFRLLSSAPFFREFPISTPIPAQEVNQFLLRHEIIGGVPLKGCYPDVPELPEGMLLSFTELTTRQQIDDLVQCLLELRPEGVESKVAAAAGVR